MSSNLLDISSITTRYDTGESVSNLISEVRENIASQPLNPVWISIFDVETLHARCLAVEAKGRNTQPLYGIPFAVKDNIDVVGLPTTCACPEFAYTPTKSATVVQKLEDAGAIVIGKTNMDQFATGLVGTRSPYGACSSVFDPANISGGSSSGSAVAVASGQVAFALGTDTAGSGRVPAAFNNIVGLKPTPGSISTSGVVPACRSLDCVSIFALTSDDASRVFEIARGNDNSDPYSSKLAAVDLPTAWLGSEVTVGVPFESQLEFFGDQDAADIFAKTVKSMEASGAKIVRFDLQPFLDIAKLLYSGPWVAERLAAIGGFLARSADSVHPVVREIILGGMAYSASDAFKGQYALGEYRKAAESAFDSFDIMLLPTTGTTYTIQQVLDDPIKLNSNLGRYTNFVNLLGLAAIAIPAGFRPNNTPFGVTLIARGHSERALTLLGDQLHRKLVDFTGSVEINQRLSSLPAVQTPPTPPGSILLAIVGAHLTGQPLNHQLTSRGARLVKATKTANNYRLYALANTTPPKPGLVRDINYSGPGIEIEIWAMPTNEFGSFVAEIPTPLGIGTLETSDREMVKGFICEPFAIESATEITHFAGWRAYLKSLKST